MGGASIARRSIHPSEDVASASPSPSRSVPAGRGKRANPQQVVDSFWKRFITGSPGKVLTILPNNPYARTKASKIPQGAVQGQRAVRSYQQARDECEKAVHKIARECRRTNTKYRDVWFDMEIDMKSKTRACLDPLASDSSDTSKLRPQAVRRVTDIYDDPQFFIDGTSPGDVRQGADGDCWLMAALATMANKPDLIPNVCIAHDQAVGVYGFVFFRDGEWQQCIIDDKLYLTTPDYDESRDERNIWNRIDFRQDAEEEYRKAYQSGSRALYFAQCENENETWLPLLEKAYAKAHGDYSSISGGYVGEGVEDLTGGVTSEVFVDDILDQDRFWKDELMNVNKDFLFGCTTGFYANWIESPSPRKPKRKGIVEMHAYSIIEAKDIKGQKLLKLRNPWGVSEWKGPWCDGSREWTPEWIELLNHKFGNDGVFWMSYKDFLRKFQTLERTRLFGLEWTITQQWTSLYIPWTADYHDTKFKITLTEPSPVVIVLSQLDDRYFRGLEGHYCFGLQFRLEREGETDYIMRSKSSYFTTRSVSGEVSLGAGTYSVLMKITARRESGRESPLDVIKACCIKKRDKLLRIGLSYDLAHAKGQFVESEKEKQIRLEHRRKKKSIERQKLIERTRDRAYKIWLRKKKEHAREKRRMQNKELKKNFADFDGFVGAGSLEKIMTADDKAPRANQETKLISDKSSKPSSEVPEGESQTPEEKIEKFNADLDAATMLNKSITVQHAESDDDSFEAFDFDPDLDVPSDSESDSEKAADAQSDAGSEDEFCKDPWNAVCVVGLRVYSKDPKLSLEIVRPKNVNELEAPLDRDHPAVAATANAAPRSEDGKSTEAVEDGEIPRVVVVPTSPAK